MGIKKEKEQERHTEPSGQGKRIRTSNLGGEAGRRETFEKWGEGQIRKKKYSRICAPLSLKRTSLKKA